MPTLLIQLPGLPPVLHVLKDETITVGRMKGNTIIIEDASVSLSHARITRKHGDFFLKDLNSTNGTTVNGQPINEVKLSDRDRIEFANIAGQFQSEEAVPGAAGQLAAGSAPAPPAFNLNVRLPRGPLAPAGLPAVATSPSAAAQGATDPAFPRAPGAQPLSSRQASSERVPRRSPALKSSRPLSLMVAATGGLAGLAFVCFIGWRALHTAAENPAKIPVGTPALVDHGEPPAPHSPAEAGRGSSGRIPPPAAIPGVGNLSASGTQDAAAPATETVSQLIRALTDREVTERRRAATALHGLGPDAKSAAPALREALKDLDPEVRLWSALTLINNQSYDKAAIPVLIQALQNPNPVLRQVACLSLGLIPYEDAEKDTVTAALGAAASKDADDEVRNAALSALNVIAPETVAKTAVK